MNVLREKRNILGRKKEFEVNFQNYESCIQPLLVTLSNFPFSFLKTVCFTFQFYERNFGLRNMIMVEVFY